MTKMKGCNLGNYFIAEAKTPDRAWKSILLKEKQARFVSAPAPSVHHVMVT